MAWYGGDRFPECRGDLFVGALVDKEVRRREIDNGAPTDEETLFGELGERIRDVRDLGDGFLYLLTHSEERRLIRVRTTGPTQTISGTAKSPSNQARVKPAC
jgi:glucose/arabinose dehydrogenase